jgi:hypothetical protein
LPPRKELGAAEEINLYRFAGDGKYHSGGKQKAGKASEGEFKRQDIGSENGLHISICFSPLKRASAPEAEFQSSSSRIYAVNSRAFSW